MNVCIYTAATSVVFTQIMLDRSFDIKYNTKTTYTFRICLGLFIMGCTCLFIPFADSNVLQVYMIGVLIGVFEGSGLATLQQLAPSIHRDLSKYANTGFTIAQVLPILLSILLGFYDAKAGDVAATCTQHSSGPIKVCQYWLHNCASIANTPFYSAWLLRCEGRLCCWNCICLDTCRPLSFSE